MIKKLYISFVALFILMSITYFVAGSNRIYKDEFDKYNIEDRTGLNPNYLDTAIDRLTGYLHGRYDDLNHNIKLDGNDRLIYNDKEISHMKDVKNIFDRIKIFSSLYFLLLALMGFKYVRESNFTEFLYLIAKYAVIGMMVLFVFFSILIFVDFSSAFYKFHEIFFTNDLWLLNPETDILIQMLPEGFFMDLSKIIIAYSTGLILLFYLIMKFIYTFKKNKQNSAL